jgi:three-Cys-motif partner protein
VTTVTQQDLFGGDWTQRKLEVLRKYLQAYTQIFNKNPRAQFYSITYVDAFAGTGSLRRPKLTAFAELLPELEKNEKEFRKGSVRRALEVVPPFDKYVFIERDASKCGELRAISSEFSQLHVEIVNKDANEALLSWCRSLDTKRERAVVFLDPFGASVNWQAVAALGQTGAVDLWVLFPYSAINRMLVRNRKPPQAWAERLTSVFGTAEWERSFYSTTAYRSLLDSNNLVESVHKSADHRVITDFFVGRLKQEFVAVSDPFPMHNSNGSLLFMFFFAAANKNSARTGLKIANDIIGKELDLS